MVTASMDTLKQADATYGRGMVQSALRTKVATNQLNSFREAASAGGMILKDMVSVTGMANAALNILISRFGTMIVVFGLYRKATQWKQAMDEAALTIDTARVKVESLIIPTTTLEAAMESLMSKMITFAIEVGGTFEQLSDTQFLLASSGLKSAQVYALFDDAQSLVLATAKDLNATQGENKQIIETFAGIYKNFAGTLTQFNTEQEKAAYIADLIFYAYRRNQILLPELAAGFTYAAAQANIMNIPLAEIILTMAKANSVMIKGSKAGTSYANALSDIIKNQIELKKRFDITLDLDKEGGFSFIKEVLVPMNKKLEESASRVQFLTDVMKVFNKRGARITAALLPKVRELVKELNNVADAEGERDVALNLVQNSLKNQLQIQKNLKIVTDEMWSRAWRGGISRVKDIKMINDLLRDQIGEIAALVLGLASMVYIVRVIAVSAYAVLAIFKNIADVIVDILTWFTQPYTDPFEHFGESLKRNTQDLMNTWEGVSNYFRLMGEGMTDLAKVAAHGFESVGEGIEWAQGPIETTIGSMERVFELEKLRLEVRKEIIKTLGREKIYYDRLGRTLDDMMDRARDLGEDLLEVKEAAGEAGVDFGEMMDLWATIQPDALKVPLAVSEEDVEKSRKMLAEYAKSGEKALNEMFDKADAGTAFQEISLEFEGVVMSFPERLEEANRLVNLELSNLRSEFKDALNELIGKEEDHADKRELIVERYWIAYMNRVRKGLKDEEHLREDYYEEDFNAMQYHTDRLIQNLKDRYNTYATLKGGATLAELSAQDLPTVPFSDILFDKDEFAEARVKMQAELDRILITLDAQIKSGVEQIVSERGAAYASIGPKFRQAIITAYEKAFETVAEIGEKAARTKEKEAFIQFIFTAREVYKQTEEAATDLAGLFTRREAGFILTGEEEKRLHEFEDLVSAQKGQVISVFIGKIKELRRELKDLLREFMVEGTGITKDKVAIEAEDLDEARDDLRKYRIELETELGIISDSLANTGDAIVDFTDVLISENNRAARNIAATVQEVLHMTSRLISMYVTYRQTISSLRAEGLTHLLGLNQMGAVIAGVAIVAGALSAIKSIFVKQEEDKVDLQQEFLPSDAAARVSADYGQARVINQRISLTPVFQFLDPSQLTEAMQRNLAVMIYDNILELEKEAG
jgi:TP901 family phage tail tape measure protein